MDPLNPGHNRAPQLSTSVQPPGAGGWVPTPLLQAVLSAGAACLVGGGTYLAALGPDHAFTWRGMGSACTVAAGGYLATFFGIKSAGPRRDATRFPPAD